MWCWEIKRVLWPHAALVGLQWHRRNYSCQRATQDSWWVMYWCMNRTVEAIRKQVGRHTGLLVEMVVKFKFCNGIFIELPGLPGASNTLQVILLRTIGVFISQKGYLLLGLPVSLHRLRCNSSVWRHLIIKPKLVVVEYLYQCESSLLFLHRWQMGKDGDIIMGTTFYVGTKWSKSPFVLE